jgi:hypothetical protein
MIRPIAWLNSFFVAILIPGLRVDQCFGAETDTAVKRPVEAHDTDAENHLKINRICFAYTPLGPERVQKVVYPGETLQLHAEIAGVSRNAQGEKEASLAFQVLSSTGKVVASQTQFSKGKPKYDRPVRSTTGIEFPSNTEPGSYTVKFTFADLNTKASRTVTEVLEVRPVEFAIVNPRFFHDKRDEIPAPCGGITGQPLSIVFSLIGESSPADKHTFDVVARVLDEEGREEARFSDVSEIKARPEPHLDLNLRLNLRLPYPGQYSVVISVAERSTGKTATHKLPLVVLNPFDKP